MIYKYIRSVKKSNTLPSTILYNKSSATKSTNKASLFNKYFLSVFNTTSFELPANSDQLDPTLSRHLLSIQISEQDVLEALMSLRTKRPLVLMGLVLIFFRNVPTFSKITTLPLLNQLK